jgi:membrane-bound lytic murein transglycosylase D
MIRAMITRLAHRKIETVTTAVLASVSALGATRVETSTAHAATPQPVLTYVTAAATGKPPATRIATTLGLPNLDNPRVDSWVKRFTTSQRRSFATQLARMDKYDNMILGKLDARDMPSGLIYLAMIESGFNPRARSPVSASGLWQFMAPTAKQFGLTVNRRVDQRNDPARSTDAALKYLTSLRRQFGSWYLAAAAYNSGPGTVSKALKRVTGRSKGTDADFYRISHRLPRETRDYVPKLIAAARIGANPERYGFRAN